MSFRLIRNKSCKKQLRHSLTHGGILHVDRTSACLAKASRSLRSPRLPERKECTAEVCTVKALFPLIRSIIPIPRGA
jgi:hypothetical protein